MKMISSSSLFVIVFLLSIPAFAIDAKCVINKYGCVTPPRTTEVNVVLDAFPCGKDPEKPCIMIYIRPSAVIELYKMDEGKLDTIDFPNASTPENKNEFSLSLSPGRYFFYIFNKNNKQRTTFGPVEIFPDVKRMTLSITMYNSMENREVLSQQTKEMCLTQTIKEYFDKNVLPPYFLGTEIQCNSSFNDSPKVVKQIE